MKEFVAACGQALLPILTPGIIVGGIVFGWFTPTEASVIAVLYAMLLGVLIYRELPPKVLLAYAVRPARLPAIALFCVGTASAFGWLLAYFQIPALVVNAVSGWGGGITGVGFFIARRSCSSAASSTRFRRSSSSARSWRRWPTRSHMHPIHFAIIGIISLAFGLVTPPYGLCLMISCSIGGIKIKDAVKDTAILFVPMLLVLLIVILFPQLILWLPRLLMPQFVK